MVTSDAVRYTAGVAVAIITTCMSALGLALQKKGHASTRQVPLFRRPVWIVGILLLVASSLLSLAVFALVGQSVASSFAALTIVWSMLFSKFILHEQLRVSDGIVAGLMVAGTLLVVVFGSMGSAQSAVFLDADQILSLLQAPVAEGCLAAYLSTLVCGIGYTAIAERLHKVGKISASSFAWRATLFIRSLVCGIFSGFVGFFSKAVVSIFASATLSIAENLRTWQVYVFILLLLTAVIAQVWTLNTSLRHFPVREAVPLYQAMVVMIGVVFGWTLYAEANGKTTSQITGFLCGVSSIICGIACVFYFGRKKSALSETEEIAASATSSVIGLALAVDALLDSCNGASNLKRAQSGGPLVRGRHYDRSPMIQRVHMNANREPLARHQNRAAAPHNDHYVLTLRTANNGTNAENNTRTAHSGTNAGNNASGKGAAEHSIGITFLYASNSSTRSMSEPARGRIFRITAEVATVSDFLALEPEDRPTQVFAQHQLKAEQKQVNPTVAVRSKLETTSLMLDAIAAAASAALPFVYPATAACFVETSVGTPPVVHRRTQPHLLPLFPVPRRVRERLIADLMASTDVGGRRRRRASQSRPSRLRNMSTAPDVVTLVEGDIGPGDINVGALARSVDDGDWRATLEPPLDVVDVLAQAPGPRLNQQIRAEASDLARIKFEQAAALPMLIVPLKIVQVVHFDQSLLSCMLRSRSRSGW